MSRQGQGENIPSALRPTSTSSTTALYSMESMCAAWGRGACMCMCAYIRVLTRFCGQKGTLTIRPTCAANIVTLQESLYDCIWIAMAAVSEQSWQSYAHQFYKPLPVKYFKCCWNNPKVKGQCTQNYTKQASFSESVLPLSLDTCGMANRKGSPCQFSSCAVTYIQGLATHAKISVLHQNVHTLHYAQTKF